MAPTINNVSAPPMNTRTSSCVHKPHRPSPVRRSCRLPPRLDKGRLAAFLHNKRAAVQTLANQTSSLLCGLPTEIVENIAHGLPCSTLVALRSTCRVLCSQSMRPFAHSLNNSRFAVLTGSLDRLLKLAVLPEVSQRVESLHFSLNTVNDCSWPEDLELLSNLLSYEGGSEDESEDETGKMMRLCSVFRKLPKVSRIELGEWHDRESPLPCQGAALFERRTGIPLWDTDMSPYNKECSMQDDFNTVLEALSQTGKPIIELKAHFFVKVLSHIEVANQPSLAEPSPGLKASLTTLRNLVLCLAYPSAEEIHSIGDRDRMRDAMAWLPKLVSLSPRLQALKLVLDRQDGETLAMKYFVAHTKLPCLRVFSLCNAHIRWHDFATFVTKHRDTLEAVVIDRVHLAASPPDVLARLMQLLATLPRLKHFSVNHVFFDLRVLCFETTGMKGCSCDTAGLFDFSLQRCAHFGRSWSSTSRDNTLARASIARGRLHIVSTVFPRWSAMLHRVPDGATRRTWRYLDGQVGEEEVRAQVEDQ